MEKAQILNLLSKLPEDTDLTDVEGLVVEKYRSLTGDALAVVIQGPPPPVAKKRGRPAKANGAKKRARSTGEVNDEKVYNQIKRRKNGIAMTDLAAKFPECSVAQIRGAVNRLFTDKHIKKTGNKRSTMYHAK